MEKMSPWTLNKVNTETQKMKKAKMIHLHFGILVPYKHWGKTLDSSITYQFIRELWPDLWPEDVFINKAVQVDRSNKKDGRVPITPKKFEAFKKGYGQFLFHQKMIKQECKTTKEEKERASRINKFGRELGVIIS
ncbi:uncharacterized protein LOC131667696 [Phymastichus coffea]|uniref:uncharacterized protein LOC131667696 n=1 Tax=Phymastichus coffea TaxID=108790 RepID=UPI00273C6F8C|nr:uncharacterized protein LOC131667696 [Phymastichus coffea]